MIIATISAMRITGGIARGQVLKVPRNDIRPTTDRTREAVFSMLLSRAEGWERGLDLYSGTGALGIEALSREMGWVDFVDQNVECCAIIKHNLGKLGFSNNAHVYCMSVAKALTVLGEGYDVIFLDPPYADNKIGDVLLQLDKSTNVTPSTLLVLPHASRSPLAEAYGELRLIKEKKHGDTCISIYRREVNN
jgi:16S rRNA (guanine966-N2)-methyltransferase